MNSISFRGNTEFNVLYFSDVHAKSKNLSHFKTAVDEFDKTHKGKNTLKLAGGDLNMSSGLKPNKFIIKYMNKIGLNATCLGNHDMEGGKFLARALEEERPNYKILAANINFTKPNKVESKIAKSTVIERNGEKVGVIGISPLDFGKLTFIASHNNFMKPKNFINTAIAVQKEVNSLEKQGINKIFLLAHTGKASQNKLEYYKYLAYIGGIDVIIGGHDHLEHDLWYNSRRKDVSGNPEPVKVVSVGAHTDKGIKGEDLDSYGVFKAIFNDEGILIPEKCSNKVRITSEHPKSQEILDWEEKYLETNKVIGYINKNLATSKPGTEENPAANLAADAMLWKVNSETRGEKAQIAFVNSGAVRGNFYKGNVTKGEVIQALPFVDSTLIKTTRTKKQIMDTLNWCVESTTLPKITPGLMQVGGMRYTIGKDNRVKDVYLTYKDGSLGERIDNQPDNKKYSVIHEIFLMAGVAGLTELKQDGNDPDVEYFPYSRQEALMDYIEKEFKNRPIEVKTGRIEFDKKN